MWIEVDNALVRNLETRPLRPRTVKGLASGRCKGLRLREQETSMADTRSPPRSLLIH
jgi:hypothetical protein